MTETPYVFHKDGTVTLPSDADPARAGTTKRGWLRHSVGLDLGRNDPTALVVVRDECFPEFTGRGFEQRLGPRKCTVVFQETMQLFDYVSIADALRRRLNQIPNWTLTIDASGLGQPFSDTLNLAGIDHWSVTMTAGASLHKKGRTVTCAKSLLLENLATGIETQALTIASDLKGKQDLLNEIASFELQATSAGNLVLAGGGKAHHADRAIALALAYLQITHLDTGTTATFQKIANWY